MQSTPRVLLSGMVTKPSRNAAEEEQRTVAIDEYLDRVSIPVIGSNDSGSWIQGTGFLLRVDGRILFVTASHVAEAFAQDPDDYGVPLLKSPESSEVLTFGKSVLGREERCDVACVVLDMTVAGELSEYWGIVEPSQCDVNHTKAESYILHGYPSERTVSTPTDVISRSITMELSEYTGPCHDIKGKHFRPEDLILSPWEEGTPIRDRGPLPEPRGISGCGVWTRTTKEGLLWTPSASLSLVAIEWAWAKNHYVRCTRISTVLAVARTLMMRC